MYLFIYFIATLLGALPTPTPFDGPLHHQCHPHHHHPTITITTTGPRPLHGDPNVGANDAASLWEAFVRLSFTDSPDCLYLCELTEPRWSHSSCMLPCFPHGKATKTVQKNLKSLKNNTYNNSEI